MTTTSRKRWQFGLGDMLWLMLICAIVMAWWVDRRRLQEAAQAELQWAQLTIDQIKEERASRAQEEVNQLRLQIQTQRATQPRGFVPMEVLIEPSLIRERGMKADELEHRKRWAGPDGNEDPTFGTADNHVGAPKKVGRPRWLAGSR